MPSAPAGAGRLLRGTLQRGPSSCPPRPGGLHCRHQPPPRSVLNCNNTYGEEPDMFRTALGESTASLDSTAGQAARAPWAVAAGRATLLRANACFAGSTPSCVSHWLGPAVPPGTRTGQSRTPSRAGALSPPSPLSRDEGARNSACPRGQRGGHGSQMRPCPQERQEAPRWPSSHGGWSPPPGAGCPKAPHL